jgi:transcriptional regulator with XRE-family HTH domain
MIDFGSRLRQERIRLGLTQAAFAVIGGVETNAQGQYESGRRNPKADYLYRIGGAGVNLTFLFVRPPSGSPSERSLDLPESILAKRANSAGENLSHEALRALFDLLKLNLLAGAKAISDTAHTLNSVEDTENDGALQKQLDNLTADSISLVEAAFDKATAAFRKP